MSDGGDGTVRISTSPCVASSLRDAGLPAQAGIGFKPRHYGALSEDPQPPGFIEVHAENYLGAGGLPHAQLAALAGRVPLSVHGVGLSIGGEQLDVSHLDRIAALLSRYPAASFSEHLAWSTHDGRFFGDLLPFPYDDAALSRVCRHVTRVQERIGHRMLLENPSTYLAYAASSLEEPQFLAEVVARTGCGLLLDLNNVHVSCHNLGRDARAYLAALPLHQVGEIHLAGHAVEALDGAATLLVDDHGSPVRDAVWALYAEVIAAIGPVPTLIEWDTDVPDYAVLRAQARRAQAVLDASRSTDRTLAA